MLETLRKQHFQCSITYRVCPGSNNHNDDDDDNNNNNNNNNNRYHHHLHFLVQQLYDVVAKHPLFR